MFRFIFLILLALLLLVGSWSFALDSGVYTFYHSATTSPWKNPATSNWAATGTSQAVRPFSTWTCQAETSTTTALTLEVTGNLRDARFPTSTVIASEVCDATDLGSNDGLLGTTTRRVAGKYGICMFSFVSQPVLQMRIDVATSTGSSTNQVICLGRD